MTELKNPMTLIIKNKKGVVTMKKLISMVLALVMVLAMAATAFAFDAPSFGGGDLDDGDGDNAGIIIDLDGKADEKNPETGASLLGGAVLVAAAAVALGKK